MKKLLEIALIIIIMTSLLAGCGEHVKGDGAARVQTSETENDQEDGLIQENDLDEVEEPTAESTVGEKQKSVSEEQAQKEEMDSYQEESRVEPTQEHDKQMLALLDEACGSHIYVYASVDMDKDGECEMIGVAYHDFSIWYCSSNLEDCYMVSYGSSHGYDDCKIEQIEFEGERHIVIDAFNMLGNDKRYSILALRDGEIEMLVDDDYGYVYMNEKEDIILNVEFYDGEYDKINEIWSTHTWMDTYLYYEDGKYKEYGAAMLSEKEFSKYDNAQEVLDEIKEENRNENVFEMRYSYFIRENGIVLVQCEEEHEEFIEYYHYIYRENGNHLDIEMTKNYGIMYPSLSWLDEVTYPKIN